MEVGGHARFKNGEIGLEGGKIGLGRELVTVGADGPAHPFGNGFGVLGFDAGRFEVAGGFERVEGAGGYGGVSAVD